MNKYELLAARWIFKQAGKNFPDIDKITDVDTEFYAEQGGHCDTCAYEYSAIEATVRLKSGGARWARYTANYVSLGEIVQGMMELDDV